MLAYFQSSFHRSSHFPSSFRQIILSSTALTMTSSFSPGFSDNSFPPHFLFVRVAATLTWYSTFISPSYWETTKTAFSHQIDLKKNKQLKRVSNKLWTFSWTPSPLSQIFSVSLDPRLQLCLFLSYLEG